jgi:glycyl-tRNA synthetase beta chain
MPELLLELGCEELPASFVPKAYRDLELSITKRLQEAGIPFGGSLSIGTPRRLIIQVQDLAPQQPDVQKDARGPALGAAFDAEGKPTKALEGFCRGQGVDVASVRKESDYVWITKTIVGRPTAEILAELLPEAIKGLNFDKAMRWGSLRMRFARPIRWILAAYDTKLVSFDINGIVAGTGSRGHRFNFPRPFESVSFNHLVEELRKREVEPDAEAREKRLRAETAAVTSGAPQMSNELVQENVFLTEWPTAVEGTFREDYLELPDPVLVMAMAKHERFFPVRDQAGKLTNKFVSIRNGGVDDVVRNGNAWVLNARFNDAKFFFDEDRKHTLADFLEKTKGIVFTEKLGTIHARAFRLSELASEVAKATGADDAEIELARQAGLYAKADLSTGLVSELPALQGLVGGEYARYENMPDSVCWAIASHYDLTRNPQIDCSGARTAVRVLIADQLDKLVGYLGTGQIPSGSSDPYGLRRAATLLIEAALRWPDRFKGFVPLIESSIAAYREQGVELTGVLTPFRDLFRSRYESIFSEARHDLIEAALLNDYVGEPEDLDPQGVRFRLKVLEEISTDIDFIQTATRPLNIVTAAVNKGIGFTFHEPLTAIQGLDSEPGQKLAEVALVLDSVVRQAAKDEDATALIKTLRELQRPINAFFDTTMVMAEDEKVRAARLSLLHGVNLLLRHAGEFSRIVISGEAGAAGA